MLGCKIRNLLWRKASLRPSCSPDGTAGTCHSWDFAGKLSHNELERSTIFMGKLTISMAMFNSYFDITRGISLEVSSPNFFSFLHFTAFDRLPGLSARPRGGEGSSMELWSSKSWSRPYLVRARFVQWKYALGCFQREPTNDIMMIFERLRGLGLRKAHGKTQNFYGIQTTKMEMFTNNLKLRNPQQKWRLKCEKPGYFHGGLSVAMFDCQRVMGWNGEICIAVGVIFPKRNYYPNDLPISHFLMRANRAKRRVSGWVGNGVAGMMTLLVIMDWLWIIPENSLRKTHQ